LLCPKFITPIQKALDDTHTLNPRQTDESPNKFLSSYFHSFNQKNQEKNVITRY